MANGVLKIATLNFRGLNRQLKRRAIFKIMSTYRKHISEKIKQLNGKENGVGSSFTVHNTNKSAVK